MSVSLVKINDKPNSEKYKEFIMDSESDVLPVTDVADGSIAYVSDLSKFFVFKNGQWN